MTVVERGRSRLIRDIYKVKLTEDGIVVLPNVWSEDSGVVPLRSFQGVCKVKTGFIIMLRYGLSFHSFSHEFSMDYTPEVMSLLQW